MLIAIGASMIASADARAADPPLFFAFKSFCIDTDAVPGAVKTAVEGVGGKLFRGPVSSPGFPYVVGLTIWNIAIDGHALSVSAGAQHIPSTLNHHRPEDDNNDCTVVSYSNDDTGIAAIRRWIGVPGRIDRPSSPLYFGGRRLPDVTLYFFSYQQVGNVRMAVIDKVGLEAAEREGRYWTVVLTRGLHVSSVQLTHVLGVPNAH
ncbi:MAG TPA: hypothetical protein VJ476_01780 [Rhizomicrobium sp.]|nr:hypothetical protein [Rhizomicrobium sp.]